MSFAESYLGRLRAAVGQMPLLAIGARVLVEDAQGRFVIVRRTDDGKWALPAGGLELGENLMQAAARELHEETGLVLRDATPFGLSSDPVVERHVYPNGDPVQSIALLVHMRSDGTLPHAGDDEVSSTRFASMAEIETLDFVAPEWPTFAHYRRFVQTGVFQIV